MSLRWVRDSPPQWGEAKERILGGAADGVFDIGTHAAGELLSGEWWRVVDDDDQIIGFGWLDTTWGDAEILLAVDPKSQGQGVGSFILDRLDDEASAAGLNYMYNLVRDTHPELERVTGWLAARGFEKSRDGRWLRQVRMAPD